MGHNWISFDGTNQEGEGRLILLVQLRAIDHFVEVIDDFID